jgi:valyl-tRNA synthetase
MIMTGYAFLGEAPFHTVYLHGTVRDTKHVRMQKSLGNGIDPLDVVQLYGADPLRYTLISSMGLGADTILDPNDLERSFAPGRNFVTKLWNIGRFLLTNVGSESVAPLERIAPERLTSSDRWILARLDAAITACDAALGPAHPRDATWTEAQMTEGLRLNEYTEAARSFVWNDLADWYVETSKARLGTAGPDRDVARTVLIHAFDQALRLLQPIVPFVTDALWQRLPGRAPNEYIAVAAWPSVRHAADRGADFELVREIVTALRQLRGEYNVAPGRTLEAIVVPRDGAASSLERERGTIERLARCTLLIGPAPASHGPAAHQVLSGGNEVIVPLEGVIDVAKECTRLRAELASLEKQLAGLTLRLANEQFIARAKPEIVAAERQKEGEWRTRSEQLRAKVLALCGA